MFLYATDKNVIILKSQSKFIRGSLRKNMIKMNFVHSSSTAKEDTFLINKQF